MVHIKSFLYLISRNSALDYLKHQKIKNQYEQKVLEAEVTENFEYFVIAEEVFILAMQGKDNEAIAKTLNISVNPVKTQKKIAYKKLKSYITEIGCILLWLHKM